MTRGPGSMMSFWRSAPVMVLLRRAVVMENFGPKSIAFVN
jgi:hypothetical protein